MLKVTQCLTSNNFTCTMISKRPTYRIKPNNDVCEAREETRKICTGFWIGVIQCLVRNQYPGCP